MGGQRDIKETIETLIAKHQSFIRRGTNFLFCGSSFSLQDCVACFGCIFFVPEWPYVNFVSRPHYSPQFETAKVGGRVAAPNSRENLPTDIFAVF
jgi:hypothetical protein